MIIWMNPKFIKLLVIQIKQILKSFLFIFLSYSRPSPSTCMCFSKPASLFLSLSLRKIPKICIKLVHFSCKPLISICIHKVSRNFIFISLSLHLLMPNSISISGCEVKRSPRVSKVTNFIGTFFGFGLETDVFRRVPFPIIKRNCDGDRLIGVVRDCPLSMG